MCVPVGLCRSVLAPWLSYAPIVGAGFCDLEFWVVLNAVTGTSHRGSDVRLDCGQLMRPSVWPR
eukprot:4556150-Amphidinium_carterae.1